MTSAPATQAKPRLRKGQARLHARDAAKHAVPARQSQTKGSNRMPALHRCTFLPLQVFEVSSSQRGKTPQSLHRPDLRRRCTKKHARMCVPSPAAR